VSVQALAGGRYAVERTLGAGGMAVVYLARDAELGRPVAIKVLSEPYTADEEFRERFLREARMAAGLAHPSIVAIYDAGEDDGRPFIVMEYVAGSTLAEEVARRQRLPSEEVVDLAVQACDGLAHAHDAGLVHRDVKPQNLLLRPDGVLKIADFGIARAVEATQLTKVGTVLGTAEYLSPEQAAGRQVTAAADLYSLGAVLYELLTGRPPYRFESLAELAAARERAIAPVRELAPEVPEPLEDVVMRCLARNPAFRPESADALARELAEASPEPPTHPIAAAPARLEPPKPGRRLKLGLGAVAALIALAVVLALVAREDSGPSPSQPPAVERVPPGSSPAERARNLAEWIRDHSG
jgi:eukaryotic-like serine/threonine-protein kinase